MIKTIFGSKVEKVTGYNVSTGILTAVLENGVKVEDHVTKFRADGGFDEIYGAAIADGASLEPKSADADSPLVYGSDEHLNLMLNIAGERCLRDELDDGYVVICDCKDVGWTRSIDEANGWLPGCFAVEVGDGEVVQIYIARGGDESVGANRWERFAEFTKVGFGGLWEIVDATPEAPAVALGDEVKVYQKKEPVWVSAFSFDDFIEYGKKQVIESGGNLVNGMPLAFILQGVPVTHENDDCYSISTQDGLVEFGREDVVYVSTRDGEAYVTSRSLFEKEYSLIEFVAGEELSFGEALEHLKDGRRIARKSWRDSEFIFLLPAAEVPKSAIFDPALRAVIARECEGDTFPALPAIRMWRKLVAQGKPALLTGWIASAEDMLAEDWIILES